jgi:hypothetical protein
MRRTQLLTWATIATLFAALPTMSADTERVFFNPPTAAVAVGDTVTVSLTIDSGIASVHFYRVKFQFDTTLLQLDTIVPSPSWDSVALAYSGHSFNYKDSLDPGVNAWYFDLFSAFYTQPPHLDGYADLAEIRFIALASGVTPVTFFDYRLENNVGMGEEIPCTAADGLIYVCPLPQGWIPGDANGRSVNGNAVDVSDLSYLVDFLFRGGPAPVPYVLNGDLDCSMDVNVSDLAYLINYLFRGGPDPCNPCG